MANVSVGFAKCFILFMAVVILVQGAVYLGLAIWGITLRDCGTTTDIAKDPFKFAMDLIYFVEKRCGKPEAEIYGQTFEISMEWEKSYKITHREFIFFVTYAVISGLWIATSLLIITTLCNATTKIISGIIYWPWFLSVIAGSILDVVATVYHGLDISHTLNMNDAFDFIGADIDPDLLSFMENFGIYFSTPAILLTCLSCRVILIWLLNVFGSTFCLSLSNILATQTAEKSAKARIAPSTSQAPTRQPTPQPQPASPQPQMQSQAVIQPVVVPEPVHMEYPEQIRPKPLPIIIPAQQTEQFQRQDRTTLQSPVMVLPPPQQQHPADINTYRHTDAHPDRLNYPPSEPPTPRAPSPAVQQLAVTSPLNNRYNEIYPTAPPANPRVSEELRNQMPWSYTSMVTKPPPPPRKPQLQVQIYPQIPEPDYAEH